MLIVQSVCMGVGNHGEEPEAACLGLFGMCSKCHDSLPSPPPLPPPPTAIHTHNCERSPGTDTRTLKHAEMAIFTINKPTRCWQRIHVHGESGERLLGPVLKSTTHDRGSVGLKPGSVSNITSLPPTPPPPTYPFLWSQGGGLSV